MFQTKFDEELVRLGVELKEGEGMFVLDFSAFFPYGNQEILMLEASLSTEPRNAYEKLDLTKMCVLNHRYPNHGYLCMTRKYGRKLCTHGCPVNAPFEEINKYRYINLAYGFKNRLARISVPIEVHLSKDLPYASLSACFGLQDPNQPELVFRTFQKSEDGGWKDFAYSITEEQTQINLDFCKERGRFKRLTPASSFEEALLGVVVYNEVVEVRSYCKAEDVMV